MRRIWFEFVESFRIAGQQLAANRTRSFLTTLGVIIGIIAVTLMGTAIRGIDTGFDKSMAMLGDDVLYVEQWPWTPGENDFWMYRNRPDIKLAMTDELNRLIEATPNSLLGNAIAAPSTLEAVTFGKRQVSNVYVMGTTSDYSTIGNTDCKAGRFLNDWESRGGRNVCVIGLDIADSLFPGQDPLDKVVRVGNQEFRVVGVFERQGSFLGLFSFDTQVVIPLTAYAKYFKANAEHASIRVKVKDRKRLAEARDQVKAGLAIAGLFITGLALFVGAVGIMNITFVSVKERTREIGTRKALGARRRTILLQFLIEAVSICLVGGVIGLGLAVSLFVIVAKAFPSFPIAFAPELVVVALIISVLTGVLSGFAPAWQASRLSPVEALRYE